MTDFSKTFSKTLASAALIAALGLSANAQETTEETAADPAVEAAAEEQTESVFNMGEEVDENGEPVAQEPQPGEQYLAEVFNDWAMRCLKVEEGEDPCQMYQLLNDDLGNSVAEIAIVALPNSGQAVAGATIVVPLETLLTEQVTLRVDGGQARRFPFNFCNLGGCVSRIGLTQGDISAFKRGAAATLSMVPAGAPDERVTATMSLSGFTAAFDAVAAQ